MLIIDINPVIKSYTIEFRKKYKLKLPDAIIAATAQFLNIPLVTADKSFNKINEIIVFQYER